MLLLLRPALLSAVSSTTANSLPALGISAGLDGIGVGTAIWTLWSCIELPAGGHLRRAFWLISLGSLAFALSHVLDTILQLINIDAATLIHQGAVLCSILLFLAGFASLTDALPTSSDATPEEVHPLKLFPVTAGITLVVSASSFILYGVGALAETAAFFVLDGTLLLSALIALGLVVRARLGGAIGRSLWLALLGLLLFSLAHPVQVWFYVATDDPPALLSLLHRLIVMPTFLLFALSITHVARRLTPNLVA